MTKNLFVFALLGALVFSACKKERPSGDTICMKRDGTQCADPWNKDGEGKSREGAIERYLQNVGVHASVSCITYENPGIVCLACNCPSGEVVYIKVNAADKAKAEAEGFVAADCPCGKNVMD